MNLDLLFQQFLKERVYLKAVTPKTRIWYETAWKAFKASQTASGQPRELHPSGATGTVSFLLTKARLQAFVVHLRDRNIRPRSVNTYLQALNAFCRWLHEEGHAPQLVRVAPLKVEKRILVVVGEQHLRALLSFKPKTFAVWRIWTLECLILDTGIRIDEALSLRESDIDFDNLLVTVFGKGQKERRLPISFECRKRLYRYQQVRERKDLKFELLFATRRGTKWGQRNALRSHYLLLAKLGIPKCGFHRLRHTFATQYLKAGGELVRLSKMLGHTQITTTMAYEHLLTEDLQTPHQRLSILSRLR